MEFVKKVYVSEIECRRIRVRPFVICKDRVQYMHERGADRGRGSEIVKEECLDRERQKGVV